jgi:CheY-like chemotaxis protein
MRRRECVVVRKTVMVVEDDADIREGLSALLDAEGYPVLLAGDGREALDVLANGNPSPGLILLDLMMPRMNGWQFLEAVKDAPRASRIPIVVMSAYRENDRRISDAALDRRVAFLRKPVDVKLLLKLIQHYCGENNN